MKLGLKELNSRVAAVLPPSPEDRWLVQIETDVSPVWAERAQHVGDEHAGTTPHIQHRVIRCDRGAAGGGRDVRLLGALVAGDRSDMSTQPEWWEVTRSRQAVDQGVEGLRQSQRQATRS